MIKISIFFTIGLNLALVGLFFYLKVWIAAVLMLLTTLLWVWFFYAARNRIVRLSTPSNQTF